MNVHINNQFTIGNRVSRFYRQCIIIILLVGTTGNWKPLTQYVPTINAPFNFLISISEKDYLW